MRTVILEDFYKEYNNWLNQKPPIYKIKKRIEWKKLKPVILPVRGSFKYMMVTKEEAKKLGY